jgi:hypothetical protein
VNIGKGNISIQTTKHTKITKAPVDRLTAARESLLGALGVLGG